MLIKEGIERVKTLYNKGPEAIDSRISNRYVYSILRTMRERLLSQELRKNQPVNEWSYQTIPCFPMIKAASHECECIPSDGCEILRSECKLPQIFTDHMGHIIKSVSKITGTGKNFLDIQFNETSWMRIKYNEGKKFTSKKPEFFIHNDYLFVSVNTSLEVVSVVAMFTDPLEAATTCDFCDNNVDPCKSYLDYDLHIDGKLEEALIELSRYEILYVYGQMQVDDRNDGSDNTGAALRDPRSYRYRNVDKNLNIED